MGNICSMISLQFYKNDINHDINNDISIDYYHPILITLENNYKDFIYNEVIS